MKLNSKDRIHIEIFAFFWEIFGFLEIIVSFAVFLIEDYIGKNLCTFNILNILILSSNFPKSAQTKVFFVSSDVFNKANNTYLKNQSID